MKSGDIKVFSLEHYKFVNEIKNVLEKQNKHYVSFLKEN